VLEARRDRIHRLLETLDRTVEQYGGGPILTDDELYAGFPQDRVAAIRQEARERWGADRVAASEQQARSMSRDEWEAVQADGDAIAADLSQLLDRAPADAAVQAVVARHHAWVSHFWTPDADAYRGLGRIYVEDPRFREFYDRRGAGTADLLRRAIDHFAAGME
jgi:MerR family transcriptional regulator, thiopeptide resistance regulator